MIGQSWGRRSRLPQKLLPIYWRDEDWFRDVALPKRLPRGAGRSYGDLCLNTQGILLQTQGLNRFLHFDEERGTITCGAGLTIGEVLAVTMPRGFSFFTCPNSIGITVGGAVAADAHGRNHYSQGSFGNHIESFELVRTHQGSVVCSAEENSELFHATIGGLGLTGVITWVKIRLKPIASDYVEGEKKKVESIHDGIRLLSEWHEKYEYVCLWWDLYSKSRGVLVGANHAARKSVEATGRFYSRLSVPFDFPRFLINRRSMKLFNKAYYLFKRDALFRRPLKNYLFTLDQLKNWNRLFGRHGFMHFHFVIPRRNENQVPEILEQMRADGETPALCIIKRFGEVPARGALSFPIPGIMVATDFKFCGQRTVAAFRRWEKSVIALGGRLYLAKDLVLTPDGFKTSYPNWNSFATFKDPLFSSDLWERLMP